MIPDFSVGGQQPANSLPASITFYYLVTAEPLSSNLPGSPQSSAIARLGPATLTNL